LRKCRQLLGDSQAPMHRGAAPGLCWGLTSFVPSHRTPLERILLAPMILDWNLDSLAITYYSGAWGSSIHTCTRTTPRHKLACVHIYSSSSHETRWAPRLHSSNARQLGLYPTQKWQKYTSSFCVCAFVGYYYKMVIKQQRRECLCANC